VRRDERPCPFEALAVEADGQPAVTLLLDELERAAIPDLDRAGAVLARRNRPLEARVLERMILDVHRKMLLSRLERHALRDGPARERAIDLEAEVVVQAPRVVPLHDEDRLLAPLAVPEWLARRHRVALAVVLGQVSWHEARVPALR
jgi:hypothetical protein